MKAWEALVSNECSCGCLVLQFCSVEFDRRGRWVSLSGPTCQRLCRPAQFGVGLGTRETRVKLLFLALSASETCMKRQSRPLRRPPPASPQSHPASNPTPQPRGIARKPCPGLVAGYEPD